ncbi:MAG: NAD(P)-dependent oxidoreductase [Armatimonadota bacterium]
MPKTLVTGAAGQVGSRVVQQLLAKGHDIKALILPDDPNADRVGDLDIELLEGNLLDPDVAASAVEGVDAVIHTANLVGPLPDMSEMDFFDNNVRSTFNTVRAASARADGLSRFVHVSSSSVYPNDSQTIAPAYNPMDEQHPQRPIGIYPMTKIIGEHTVMATARETGLQVSIIRPSGICSGDAVLNRWTVRFVCGILRAGQRNAGSALHMANGTELSSELEQAAESPDQQCAIADTRGRPWVYQLVDARDVAHGCICALEPDAAVGEAFNIAAPRPIPYPEAARIVADATGSSVINWEVPVRWIFDLDITKAKTLIDYQPKWDIAEMVDSAMSVRAGELEPM